MKKIRKTRKYRFWLQKVVKIWIWQYFIDGQSLNCVSLHFSIIFGQFFFYGQKSWFWRTFRRIWRGMRFFFGDSSRIHSSSRVSKEKFQKSYQKIKGILLPHNYVKFTLVKITASKVAYTSLWMTKNEHFLTTSHRKVVREIFFRDFGYIMLLKNSFRLIKVINRTNSQPNWTRRSEKRYHWKKDGPRFHHSPP